MDYLQIIINGITDQNAQKHLTDYFIREIKKAEKENYSLTEFFEGCKSVIDGWENEIQNTQFKKTNECYLAIAGFKNGEIKPAKKEGDEHKTAEQRINEAVERWETKLAWEKEINNHRLNLTLVTNGRLLGNVDIAFIENLKEAIKEAFNQISLPPLDQPPQQAFETKQPKKFNAKEYALAYIFDLDAKGNNIPTRPTEGCFDKKGLMKIGHELYQLDDEKDTFYKAVKCIANEYDRNKKTDLENISKRWIDVIKELSKDWNTTKSYLIRKKLIGE